MTNRPAIDAADREAALGTVFRGIAHESANTLNAILMNAQLGMLSDEEAAASLETIATQARSGGKFLKRISAFAGAADLAPHTEASLAECVGLARKLIGTRVRRSGLKLSIDAAETPKIPLDPFGAAVTIALLIDRTCSAGAERAALRTAVNERNCELRLTTEATGKSDRQAESLALRFAYQLARDHRGHFEALPDGWLLVLPRDGDADG